MEEVSTIHLGISEDTAMIQAETWLKNTPKKIGFKYFSVSMFPVSFSSHMSCLAQTEKCMGAAWEIGLHPPVPLLLTLGWSQPASCFTTLGTQMCESLTVYV